MHQLIRPIMVFHFGYINTLNETSSAMNHIDLLLLISWELTSLRHSNEELISYFKILRESIIKEKNGLEKKMRKLYNEQKSM